jgi:2-keto-4-pentenoate hydratase/2-oxohepta-3-ene-1,7-dioic acid hydratase in catechol pathway
MRLTTFDVPTQVGPIRRIGALAEADTVIVDLGFAYSTLLTDGGSARAYEEAAFAIPPDMIEFFRGGARSQAAAEDALAFVNDRRASGAACVGPRGEVLVYLPSEVRICAPVPVPNSIRLFSTYLSHGSSEHAKRGLIEKGIQPEEMRNRMWRSGIPAAYKGNRCSVLGPDDDAYWPPFTEKLDIEMELGFFIGRQGRDISEDEAPSHIAGYTICLDVSARDLPWGSLGPYKDKDFCNILGPVVVTPDEFDPQDAPACWSLNGEKIWEGNVAEPRAFTDSFLVAFASDAETLYPGDLLTTGTIGMQCSIDTGVWPKPGDVCEFEISGIGVLRTTIARPDAPRPLLSRDLSSVVG